jgi:hypothetical protein
MGIEEGAKDPDSSQSTELSIAAREVASASRWSVCLLTDKHDTGKAQSLPLV